MRLTKRRSKKVKKLEEEHAYLDRKVKELTKDRLKDRSSESKDILNRLKRTKLMIKDAIQRAKSTLTKYPFSNIIRYGQRLQNRQE